MLEARDQNAGETELDWMTAIRSDFANSVALQGQIVIAAGYGYLTSAVSGRVYWRPLATPMAARVTNWLATAIAGTWYRFVGTGRSSSEIKQAWGEPQQV